MAASWQALDIRGGDTIGLLPDEEGEEGEGVYYYTSEDEEEESDEEAERRLAETSKPHHGSLFDRLLRLLPQFQISYDQATYTVDEVCGWHDAQSGEWVAGTANTGDLLLMAGDDASSNAVRLTTPSDWSHVGLLLVSAGDVYLLESVRVRDQIPSFRADGQKEYRSGVRVVLLRDKLRHYHGHAIAIRHLSCVNEETERAIQAHLGRVLEEVQKLYVGMPYDTKPLDFLNVKLWFRSKPREGDDPRKKYKHGLFCSSLIAEVFLRAGMVPGHLCQDATCYSPESFADTGEFYPVFPARLLEGDSDTGPRILEQLGSLAGYETNHLIAYAPELMVTLPNAVATPAQCLRRWWCGRRASRGTTLPLHERPAKSD